MLKNKRIYTDDQKKNLWDKYNSGDQSVFTDLCEAYIPLVEYIANANKKRLPDSVEVGDLISEGFIGLADAVSKFDPKAGAKFDTYATSRIRGRIMDALRDCDPISRHYRGKFKQLNTVIDNLFEILQREPTVQEIADEIGWSEKEILKIQDYYVTSFVVNIDEVIQTSTNEFFSLAEVIADKTISEDPGHEIEKDIILKKIIDGMHILSELEGIVVYWRHYDNLNLDEIADRLELKAPRVSLIYSSAIEKLMNHLRSDLKE